MQKERFGKKAVVRTLRPGRLDLRGFMTHRSHIYVVCLDGPLLAPLTDELSRRIRSLCRRGERTIVLDLARVSRIDAAGIGQLVRAYNVAVAADSRLQIVHVTRWPHEMLELVGLLTLLSAGQDRSGPIARGGDDSLSSIPPDEYLG
jgi:anti-anti-sigma factor